MNTVFLFDFRRASKQVLSYIVLLISLLFGVFAGYQFNMTIGDKIYLNSAYTIGFMIGILSLSIIFFASIFATKILFKEWDSKFDIVLFSMPISKKSFLQGKFLSLFLQTFLCFFVLIIGFIIGQNLRTGDEMQPNFNLAYYLYPLVIFGIFNCLLVCSFLFFAALTTRKKLLVVVGGLLLYVLYFVVLLFSNSPFMAGALPQSLEAQQMSALVDPFGLSGYFLEAKDYTIQQKNNELVSFSGFLLWNRILFLSLSIAFLGLTYRLFTFSSSKRKAEKKLKVKAISKTNFEEYQIAKLNFGLGTTIKSVISYTKIDLIYLFKSIVIVAVSILILFYVGMEMYAEIDKGIRLPQNYASSGLMATAIFENFHMLGMLISVYFVNDLFWRSQVSNFLFIEKTTYFFKSKNIGHFLSISILQIFFSVLLIGLGLIFQISFNYPNFDWKAYSGVFTFATFPIILFSGLCLLINHLLKNRFLALGVSVLALILSATPVSQKIFTYPLLRIFSDFKGNYSDLNAYGFYDKLFLFRILFGCSVVGILWIFTEFLKSKKLNIKNFALVFGLLLIGFFSGKSFMTGYIPKNEDQEIQNSYAYEKNFRKYKNQPQPTISDVSTEIELFPSQNSYKIKGKYRLVNQSDKVIEKILVNFNSDLKIVKAIYKSGSENHSITNETTEIQLKKTLQPNETASLDFELSYQISKANGHESVNAIIENGSFMRISRYYPSFGYQQDLEIQDEQKRKEFNLGKKSELKKLDPKDVFDKDFINLNMIVSTESPKTAVGTGDLVKQWTKNNRSYFQYQVQQIPFRFAVSSAKYQIKTENYKDVKISVLYDEKHFENVNHLLKNAKLTLDYCIQNFGKYPFKSIQFAEVSSFTKGFAATAYPSTIFMTEDLLFHANINADRQQDVINELAGHELSHLWWGNSQIDPQETEGSKMLTETLAMYTEMMLYKQMHGREKMMERVKVHQQIYNDAYGVAESTPVVAVNGDGAHSWYSQGGVAWGKLSDLIGENKVNEALRNFLKNNKYPKKPTSLDLLKEFYLVALNRKAEIDGLFKK